MAQVIAVLERQGGQVIVSDEGRTNAIINGTPVRFEIEEPVHKIIELEAPSPEPDRSMGLRRDRQTRTGG